MLGCKIFVGGFDTGRVVIQLGLMRANCFHNGIFLVALSDDALTYDAAKIWQAELHSPTP